MTEGPLDNVLPAHPQKPLIYSSPSIQERRRRILKEARKIIARDGIEGFSIRDLCRQAGVAQRTLYNAFQNKDRLIALAIREAYEDVNRYIRYQTSVDTLEGIVDRLISINTRNLKARNYTRAVMAIYFSSATSRDIWDALREMVYLNLRQWLDRLAREGGLQDWVDVEELAGEFAHIEYATINDWAQGRLSDSEYVKRLVISVLSLVVGVTVGDSRDAAIAMLREIRRTGELPQFPKSVFSMPREDASPRAEHPPARIPDPA